MRRNVADLIYSNFPDSELRARLQLRACVYCCMQSSSSRTRVNARCFSEESAPVHDWKLLAREVVRSHR